MTQPIYSIQESVASSRRCLARNAFELDGVKAKDLYDGAIYIPLGVAPLSQEVRMLTILNGDTCAKNAYAVSVNIPRISKALDLITLMS